LFAGAVFLLAGSASAGVKVAETEDFTLELGMRLQPRLEFARIPAGGEFARDFLVRRSRWKANGKMQKATYVFEWKIDGTDGIGSTPSASVENGYVQYPLGAGVDVRAGLYDQPFSRDRLTSDSKQLVVDRGAVSNVPDALGLADNVVGVQVLGKVRGGRALYTVGLFDNRFIPGALQDLPMVVGRLDLNLGATKDLYQDAHFGDDKWYSLGLNGSYQAELEDPSGADGGSRGAVGVDGMMDVPAGAGRALLRGEFNVIEVVEPTGGNGIDTRVWMVGAGYLIDERVQPVVRFDQVLLDDAAGGGSRNITYAGINFYKKQHGLKLQADLRFESGTGEAVDGGRLQAQIDF
jgi:hypothetical protein